VASCHDLFFKLTDCVATVGNSK